MAKPKIKTDEEIKAYQAQWQRDNREKRSASAAKYRAAHPERVKQSRQRLRDWINKYKREWRAKKKEIGINVDAAWKLKNKDKLKAYKAKHEAKYPHKPIEMNAKRRAAKKNATTSWANRKYIQLFYQIAKMDTQSTGIKMVVDHIVPLQSKFVCGLHCEDNLQILTVSENAKKLNVVWPDMW